jgi:hypothetical protein
MRWDMATNFGTKRFPRLVLLFLILACTSSCFSGQVHVSKDLYLYPIDIKDKIPMRIALILKPDLQNYIIRGTSASARVSIYIGDALSSGTETILNNIFHEVTISKYIDIKNVSHSDFDAIIYPTVVKGDYVAIGWPAITNDKCLIIMKWTIIDSDGKTIYVNTFSGEGDRKRTGFGTWTVEEQINECMVIAIEDHFQKALDDISNRKWYQN